MEVKEFEGKNLEELIESSLESLNLTKEEVIISSEEIKGSLLNKIFGSKIEVNSRHNYKLSRVEEPFKVTALSEDNVIEALEYIDEDNFILGVQFHPENLDNMENLYNIFLMEVLKRKMNRNG